MPPPPLTFDFLSLPMWYLALGFALFGLVARALAVYRMALKERLTGRVSNNPLAFVSLFPTGMAMLFAFVAMGPAAGLALAFVCMVVYYIAITIVKSKLGA